MNFIDFQISEMQKILLLIYESQEWCQFKYKHFCQLEILIMVYKKRIKKPRL